MITNSPFLCPQYSRFRFTNLGKKELAQYCPATGRKIDGECSKEDLWFDRMCPACQRLKGITPALETKRAKKSPVEDNNGFLTAVLPAAEEPEEDED